MDNEKLLKERNEKLALFGGFKKLDKPFDRGLMRDVYWLDPDTFPCKQLPDFEKVDNCIKWLLPKIEGLDEVHFHLRPISKGYYWKLIIYSRNEPFGGESLAEAIEKYVDWVKENEGNG